ncbi:methyltransferase, FkbM family [Rhizobiales bacterium GAS191]|nr:methyltransferase, FkbM family [Rhizobiales bacterium GAS191]
MVLRSAIRFLYDHSGPVKNRVEIRRRTASLRRWTDDDTNIANFYSQFVGNGDLVFDVGANIGNRAKIFVYLKCRVVCVEPQPHCVRVLRSAFGKKVSLEPCALSDRTGTEKMRIARANTVSSMSDDWIDQISKSGRFAAEIWDREIEVKTKTLDELIAVYGRPKFIKIDVEGYEPIVIKGLSCCIDAISFEFVPEVYPAAFACVDRIEGLGSYEFNYSEGESMKLRFERWVDGTSIKERLLSFVGDTQSFGDIYARRPVGLCSF